MSRLTAVLLVSVLVLATQGYAKDPKLSEVLLHACYIALGYETAGGFVGEWDADTLLSAKVLPEDRQALANVSDALKKWNRYTVTINPKQADLLIAVRTGRVASANAGVIVEGGSVDPGTMTRRPPGIGIGPAVGVEAGPPSDLLAVYQGTDGQEGPRLWRKTEDDGLVGKDPPLVESFKHDVEAAARKAKKP